MPRVAPPRRCWRSRGARHMSDLFAAEAALGSVRIAGVDEAGRGPLAGPVVAAAVILAGPGSLADLDDSKKLSASQRECLSARIRCEAIAYSVAFADRDEIDRINILNATLNAMARAVTGLSVVPALVLVDGNQRPPIDLYCRTEVSGDARFASIAAASVLAKVARDRYMRALDARYPGYGFARHKGYGTRAHCEALNELGATPEHRTSFAPVRKAIASRGG